MPPMPITNYGLLVGRPVARRLGISTNAHYQVHLIDDTTDYRIAINVKSELAPSELLCLVDEHFEHPILAELAHRPLGYQPLENRPGGVALDFIRANLFDPAAMRLVNTSSTRTTRPER